MEKKHHTIEQTRGMVKNHEPKPNAGGTKGHSKPNTGSTHAGPPPPPKPKQ